MNDSLYFTAILLMFVAVFLALEALLIWWNSTSGPEAKRLAKRLRMLSAGNSAESSEIDLLKRSLTSNSPTWGRLLLTLPRLRNLDRLIVQSGLDWTLPTYATYSGGLFSAGLLFVLLAGHPFFIALIVAVLFGISPTLYLLNKRNQRLKRFEETLPEALDLIGRALRAGHSLSSALKMVGMEMPDPIGEEFRQTFDEINFGISTQDALQNLARRVPSTDLGFFVVALLIQRETGGNLSEIMDNISSIIRERLKLLGKVKALSAEGRFSGIVLTLLPFFAATVLYMIDSEFLSLLWSDETGLALVKGGLLFMVIGALWMRRIVRIHV